MRLWICSECEVGDGGGAALELEDDILFDTTQRRCAHLFVVYRRARLASRMSAFLL